MPAGTLLQLPRASGSAHDSHGPEHLSLQQTPWRQTAFRHSLFAVHEAPNGLRPQLLETQTEGIAPLLSLQQATEHRAPSQAKGEQDSASGYTHTEAPLHVAGGV